MEPSYTTVTIAIVGGVIAPGGTTAGDELDLNGSQTFSMSVWGTDVANTVDQVHIWEATDASKQYVENVALGSAMTSAISAGPTAIAKMDRTIGNATQFIKVILHSTAGVTGYRIALRGI